MRDRETRLKDLKAELCKLYGLLEMDNPCLRQEMRNLARSIEAGVRYATEDYCYHNTPILDGLKNRVPLGEPVTVLLYNGEGEDRHERLYQCIVNDISGYFEGGERICFTVVKRRCRKPDRIYYHSWWGHGLIIWKGYQDPQSSLPLYEYQKS